MTDTVERATELIRASGTQITQHAWSINPARAARALAAEGLFAGDAAKVRINKAQAKLDAVYDLLPIGICGTPDELFTALGEIRAALTGDEDPAPVEHTEMTPGVERQAQWFHDGWQEALADLGQAHTALAKQVANNRVLHAELAKLRAQVTTMGTHVGALRRLAGVDKHTDPTRAKSSVTAEQLSEITRRYHDDAYVSNQDDVTAWYAKQFGIEAKDD